MSRNCVRYFVDPNLLKEGIQVEFLEKIDVQQLPYAQLMWVQRRKTKKKRGNGLTVQEQTELIQNGIMAELGKGDRNAGELKDALGIKRYPELWSAIASLEKAQKVRHYFKETSPSATLTYSLTNKEPARTAFWQQQRSSEQPNNL